MQKIKKAALPSSFLLPLPPFRCLPPRGPRSPADKKGLCNKMARRHRHTQQGKEPRCPRPPPPLLHRGRSQSPDRSPRPQGRGVSPRAGSRRLAPPPRAHTWPGWGRGAGTGLRAVSAFPPRLQAPRAGRPLDGVRARGAAHGGIRPAEGRSGKLRQPARAGRPAVCP